jgi:DNA polymerase-1
MNELVFDIETTGIDNFRTLEGLTGIHCIVTRCGDKVETYFGDKILEGIEQIRIADVIIGHNIQSFDIPAIQYLYPDWEPTGLVRDTKLLARLAWSNVKDTDYQRKDFPKGLIGAHSLKAWGYRLGEYKGEYEGGWESFSQEMLDYCVQDTMVTQKLWDAVKKRDLDPRAVQLEHDFGYIIDQQMATGFTFNEGGAASLYAVWSSERDKLHGRLVAEFPPTVTEMKMPQYWEVETINPLEGHLAFQYPTKSAAKRDGFTDADIKRGPNKIKTIPFNPDSRQQIASCLIDKYGWKPTTYTPNGHPKIDESILKTMPYGEAKILVDYLTISKRISQLAEGREAWLKSSKDNRLYGYVNTNGTVTGRCTHSRPNVAQVPSTHAKYGAECRALFTASDSSRLLVGCDASGLELRCLAHYLHPYDNGKYIDIILNGDIHSANQKAAGLETRDQAKTFIYGLIYGAGAPKIGEIIGGGPREGKILMNRFASKMPALGILKDAVVRKAKKAQALIGLDGRHIPIRSEHSALNALLQSAGAVIMKQATVYAHNLHRQEGLNVKQVAHIHDEIQYDCLSADAEKVGELAVQAIVDSGTPFGFRCPLDGEYHVGKTWADTH